MPERAIGAGRRGHRLCLVDRAEQCPPHRCVIERRMQMVETQKAYRSRILGNHRDIAVAGDRLDEVTTRHFPPVDFAGA